LEKHRCKILVIALLFLYALPYVWYPVKSSYAKAKLPNEEEEVYSLDYVHAETNPVSIANYYFEKPVFQSIEPVYDHRYTVRFNVDLNSLEKLDQQAIDTLEIKATDLETVKEQKITKKSEESKAKISNFTIILMIFLMILAFVMIYVIRKTNKKKKEILS
jgi:hypothetical protein